jgi:hypothetical protein
MDTYLFGIQITQIITGHMLCEANGFVTDRNGMPYYFFELVFGMARAELARMGVHCERHG